LIGKYPQPDYGSRHHVHVMADDQYDGHYQNDTNSYLEYDEGREYDNGREYSQQHSSDEQYDYAEDHQHSQWSSITPSEHGMFRQYDRYLQIPLHNHLMDE